MHQEFFEQGLKECEEKRYAASLIADFKSLNIGTMNTRTINVCKFNGKT